MKRRTFTSHEKAHIALDALKGEESAAKIGSLHEVHPNLVKRWKKTAEEELHTLFSDRRKKESEGYEKKMEGLYTIIGERETELSWLKKKLHIES